MLRLFRRLVCFLKDKTDTWAVPEALLDGLYDETMTYEQAKELLDKQAKIWGDKDPEIYRCTHFLELVRGDSYDS
jgi:hypothetical protein